MFEAIKLKLAQFSIRTAAKKAVITGAQAGAAYLVAKAPAIAGQAAAYGVTINLDPIQVEAALVLVIGGALEAARNMAKRLGPAWLSDWL